MWRLWGAVNQVKQAILIAYLFLTPHPGEKVWSASRTLAKDSRWSLFNSRPALNNIQ